MNIQSVIEVIFSCGLFINAALFVPQIIRIIKEKDTKDLSLITFVGFWVLQLTTVFHGFLNDDYILAFGYILSLITCGAVVFLIIFYRVPLKKNPPERNQ